MSVLATPAHMKAHATPGLFAHSFRTGERYSATPGDYWNRPPHEPLLDSEGEPMVLAFERVEIIELEEA